MSTTADRPALRISAPETFFLLASLAAGLAYLVVFRRRRSPTNRPVSIARTPR